MLLPGQLYPSIDSLPSSFSRESYQAFLENAYLIWYGKYVYFDIIPSLDFQRAPLGRPRVSQFGYSDSAGHGLITFFRFTTR